MKIKIPIKPLTVNQAWQGRRFKSKAYNQYVKDISILLPKRQLFIGLLEVRYKFYLKHWKTTDYDNLIKPLQDILVKNEIIEDDRFIMYATIEKIPSKEDYIEIEINKYES